VETDPQIKGENHETMVENFHWVGEVRDLSLNINREKLYSPLKIGKYQPGRNLTRETNFSLYFLSLSISLYKNKFDAVLILSFGINKILQWVEYL
jgi:hypothetical protein